MSVRRLLLISISIAALCIAAAAGALAAGHSRPAQPKRTVLGEAVDPSGARGHTMAISRVTIPAGAKLAWHRHPGTQLSRIVSGTLTYTVGTRSVRVLRGDPGSGHVYLVRTIRAGQTGRIRAGQWLVERPHEIHRAANRGRRPVRIVIATLLRKGAPAAIPAKP